MGESHEDCLVSRLSKFVERTARLHLLSFLSLPYSTSTTILNANIQPAQLFASRIPCYKMVVVVLDRLSATEEDAREDFEYYATEDDKGEKPYHQLAQARQYRSSVGEKTEGGGGERTYRAILERWATWASPCSSSSVPRSTCRGAPLDPGRTSGSHVAAGGFAPVLIRLVNRRHGSLIGPL